MIESVEIFGKTVTIKHDAPKGGKDAGECHHLDCIIAVSPKQSIGNQRDTLLHEITHFIDEEMQTKMTERQVRLLSTGLYAVLRGNPALVAFLMES
jgi:hypothetical protein